MREIKLKVKVVLALNIIIFFFILFGVLVAISYVLIRESLLSEVKESLSNYEKVLQSDLTYTNGKWDTSKYNADPLTAYPNTTSAFPIYIITTNGFVIERSKPISNLLDTSNFEKMLQISEPQTINAQTNESWRALAAPIKEGNNTYGVILVSYYSPDAKLMDKIDEKLRKNAEEILSKIKIVNEELDTSKLDIRNIHFDVSFEIVNKYNKVVLNNGRTPSFIDPSYVETEIKNQGFRQIYDPVQKEEFMVLSTTITSNNNPVGIIVIGGSIKSTYSILTYYMISAIPTSLALIPALSFLAYLLLSKEVNKIKKDNDILKKMPLKPDVIKFDKKESKLFINTSKIDIPYSSNQYYFCKAMFSAPTKKWDSDELSEKFGDDFESRSSRKIYDTSLAINKKAQIRLVIYQDKTYRFNPEYLQAIISGQS